MSGPASYGKIKEDGKAMWLELRAALQRLEIKAEAKLSLKSAIGGVISCLDIVQSAAASHEDYEKLAIELKGSAEILLQYVNELDSDGGNSSIALMISSIATQVKHIEKRRGRRKIDQLFTSNQDAMDVIKHYRQIEASFRQIQSDITLRSWKNTNDLLVNSLLRGMYPVDDARYNSSYSTAIKRRECTPRTREKIQVDLHEWVQDPEAPKMYWMNGMAGTGKTTLAYSLCKWLEENGQLGASFFCSRGSASCGNVNRVIPTIAYQLARYSPSFRSALCDALKEDPDAGTLNMVQQVAKLVLNPLRTVQDGIPSNVVVVIDALDECEDNHGVRLLIRVLLSSLGSLPLKFFLSSRPEPTISDQMLSLDKHASAILHLHDIEKEIVEADVRRYLIEALSDMFPPPADEDIEALVKRAGKLFIYAATAARYICPEEFDVDTSARLKTMLGADSSSYQHSRSTKYHELDQLYATILAAAFHKRLEPSEYLTTQLVLRTVVCAKEPMTVQEVTVFTGASEQQVLLGLKSLRSVLHMAGETGPISTLHTSFPDFLLNQLRSETYHCETGVHNSWISTRCFEIMKSQLRFNICHLESSFVLDRDVPDLPGRVERSISPALFYACRYWSEHLQLAAFAGNLCDHLANFLAQGLLFWMEVLNLTKCIGMGSPALLRAKMWLLRARCTGDIIKQITEARSFITRFAANLCSASTPHIYISVLPFLPKTSSVYRNYWKRMRGLIDVKGSLIERIEEAPLAVWYTGGELAVTAVALCSDDLRIASGHGDGTVHVWNAHTGTLLAGPLNGHTDRVSSVAFSLDGSRVVSGSKDCTIRVWDSNTGMALDRPFEGSGPINSLVLSPDSSRIVTGDAEGIVQVWDAFAHTSNVLAGPLEPHAGSVKSVVFSPNGSHIVAGYNTGVIRMWDAHTGVAVDRIFDGHVGSVNSMAFSPDSSRVVAGYGGGTIRVWNAHTGFVITGSFSGLMGPVHSVAFSSDGSRVVAGTRAIHHNGLIEDSIQVWDAQTGITLAGPFALRHCSIISMAFSPNDSLIIVAGGGIRGGTIQIWDVITSSSVVARIVPDLHQVRSVAFSSDCSRIVSGYGSGSIQVWNAQTGTALAGPYQAGVGSVESVEFSPDGARIVTGGGIYDYSGSEYGHGIVQLWDAYTGTIVANSFEEHTGWITSVAFSPDGSRIVAGDASGTVQVRDGNSVTLLVGLLLGHGGPVNSVVVSPDGFCIVSGADDGTIRVWDLNTGAILVGPLRVHTHPINSVAFSPDGLRIVTGDGNRSGLSPEPGTIQVWDARTGTLLAGPFQSSTDLSWVNSVAFSPDGSRIVVGGSDNIIRTRDAYSGAVLPESFEGHCGQVRLVAFSPDGSSIVSTSDDGTIRVWDARTSPGFAREFRVHAELHVQQSDQQREPNEDNIELDKPFIDKPFGSSSGWIVCRGTLICWVSWEHHRLLPIYPTIVVIDPDRNSTASIHYDDLLLGSRWSECYIHD